MTPDQAAELLTTLGDIRSVLIIIQSCVIFGVITYFFRGLHK